MMLWDFNSVSNLESDIRHWEIHDITNGIKCIHTSGDYEEYFEYDEIEAINAFEGKKPMSVYDLFLKLIITTPKTKGFAYNSFNIISKIDKPTQNPKGFIIRPRLHDVDSDIDKKTKDNRESYVSIETLKATNLRDFFNIILLPKSIDVKLQQVLDTEDEQF